MQYRLLLTFLLLSPLYLSAMDMDDEIGGGFEDRYADGVGSINGDGVLTTPLLAGLPAADEHFRPATPARYVDDHDNGNSNGFDNAHRSNDAPPTYPQHFQPRLLGKRITENVHTTHPSLGEILCCFCRDSQSLTYKTKTVNYVYDDDNNQQLQNLRHNAVYYAHATSMGYEVKPVHGSYPWDPKALTCYPKEQE